jgi:hypothetical protein
MLQVVLMKRSTSSIFDRFYGFRQSDFRQSDFRQSECFHINFKDLFLFKVFEDKENSFEPLTKLQWLVSNKLSKTNYDSCF